MTLLAVEGLHAYYGDAHILQGVSLAVGAGEVVTLIGRNGAGKTTTLRTIMGLVPPRGGRITFAGRELAGVATHEIARTGIAYVPEERRILPNLSVAENLRLGMLGAVGRVQSEDGVVLEEVLTYFPRLKERYEQKGKSLSGGEQQMLAIARGLVARPKLMLVDEPTEGLSPILIENLTAILGEINRRGTRHSRRAPRRSGDPAALFGRVAEPQPARPGTSSAPASTLSVDPLKSRARSIGSSLPPRCLARNASVTARKAIWFSGRTKPCPSSGKVM